LAVARQHRAVTAAHWTLKELDAALPSDWTGYDYLVLEMKASSPQRFWLTLYGGDKVQRRHVHPLANVWIKRRGARAVPLREVEARVLREGSCRRPAAHVSTPACFQCHSQVKYDRLVLSLITIPWGRTRGFAYVALSATL
jgi:hypothetical protein